MSKSDDPEVRRKRISRRWKIIFALLAGFIVSPVIMMTIKGLIGLTIAGAVGFVIVQFAPVFSMKIANWKLKAIKAEAEKNPIETMQNIYIEKSEAIKDGDQKIVQFETRLADYLDKLEGFKERFPAKSTKFEEIAGTMKRGLASMKRKQAVAKDKQVLYRAKIEEAEAIFEMAKAARSVTELNADARTQVFQEIKEQVSFESVNREFNAAVAELNMEVENDKEFSIEAFAEEKSSQKQIESIPEPMDSEIVTSHEKVGIKR